MTTTITATGIETPDTPNRKHMRKLAYSMLALSVLALGAAGFTEPAEAGSCTGYAALERPLLPVA